MTRGDALTFAPWLLFATGLTVLWLRLRRSGRGARRAEPMVRIPPPRPDPDPESAVRREAPEPPPAANDAGASGRDE